MDAAASEALATESPTDAPEPSPSPSPFPSPTPSPTPSPSPTPQGRFVHPGVVTTTAQLDYVRRQVAVGRQPWAEAYRVLQRSEYGSLSWSPSPRDVVECGAYSNPDLGCTDEWRDATAANAHVLLWVISGDERHARKAAEIIDAWSAVLRDHTGANAQLQAAKAASSFVRAAELLRHTDAGWPAESVARAESMFRDVMLPRIVEGGPARPNGNWDLIAVNAMMAIAVFLDDETLFDTAVQRWRVRLPAFIYHSADGPNPVPPPNGYGNLGQIGYWHGQRTYVDGLTQETCRDLEHTGWGLAAMSQAAETAWIQGVDLWFEAQARLVAALELHAGFSLGDPVPGWLCGGSLKSRLDPIPELAYNHYANRVGLPLPRTAQLVEAGRPQPARHFYGWDTLTSTPLASPH